jgi:hypothetical protein
MSRNKFPLDRPRPVGVPLQRRRRASGGGVPPVNPLYRSPGLVLRRPLLAAGLPAFCFKAVEQVLGVVVFWRLDQARASLDGCKRAMGDRRWLHPVSRDGCLLRLLSKPACDGALLARGDARGLPRRRWSVTRILGGFGFQRS